LGRELARWRWQWLTGRSRGLCSAGFPVAVSVRVVAARHPLTGKLLRARHVYRRYGRIWLVVVLPDGGVSSVQVEDTDVLAVAPVPVARVGSTVVSVDGARRLLGLVVVLRERRVGPEDAEGQR
jgi:hypothetical protein